MLHLNSIIWDNLWSISRFVINQLVAQSKGRNDDSDSKDNERGDHMHESEGVIGADFSFVIIKRSFYFLYFIPNHLVGNATFYPQAMLPNIQFKDCLPGASKNLHCKYIACGNTDIFVCKKSKYNYSNPFSL